VWNVELLTIFPNIFDSFFATSLVGKAIARGLFVPHVTNIRDFASPPHHKVDDTPYGGGAGMVMLADPLVKAVEGAKKRLPSARVVLLSPAGQRFTQSTATDLSQRESLIIICCRYEGLDQRVVDLVVDEEISIGDFVVMGGEVPAMLLLEACLRLRPEVLHNPDSVLQESFSPTATESCCIEAPQYTRPEVYRGLAVPDVLLSGNHKAIASWREEESVKRTTKVKRGQNGSS
jgi:tRNA (guanine37-N1)-methyltransferase